MFWLTERILPAAFASSRSCDRLVQRQRQRLLRQDRLDVRLLQRVADQRRLLVRRIGEVDDLDAARPRSAASGVSWTVGMPQRSATFCGVGLRARGDGHHRKAGLLVGGEMAFGHDHAGADRSRSCIPWLRTVTSGSNPLASPSHSSS